MNHVFLVGFMGAGKSTVGKIVARHLKIPFIDMDLRIEAEDGRQVSQIFEEDGEARFREIESQVLSAIESESAAVVACGGGVILSDENRAVLKRSGVVVYLKVTAGEALARIGDIASRPLLAAGAGSMAASILEARESLYGAAADLTVDTESLSREQVADSVIRSLGSELSE